MKLFFKHFCRRLSKKIQYLFNTPNKNNLKRSMNLFGYASGKNMSASTCHDFCKTFLQLRKMVREKNRLKELVLFFPSTPPQSAPQTTTTLFFLTRENRLLPQLQRHAVSRSVAPWSSCSCWPSCRWMG